MKRMWYFLAALMALTVMASAWAVADAAPSYLAAHQARVSCTIDFYNAILNQVSTAVPQVSSTLAPSAAALAADKTQLASFVNSNDTKSFSSFYTGTLVPDLRAANQALVSARAQYKNLNVSIDERNGLKSSYNGSRQTYVSCIQATDVQTQQARLNEYTQRIAQAQQQIAKLAGRNISTDAFSAIVTEAQSTIITPLQQAIAANQVVAGKYCLYSGCTNGTNDHFDAKWTIATLNAYVARVTPIATRLNLTADLSAIQSAITQSSTALSQVGTTSYTKDTESAVFGPIKTATQAMKTLQQDARQAMQQMRTAREQIRAARNATRMMNGTRPTGREQSEPTSQTDAASAPATQ